MGALPSSVGSPSNHRNPYEAVVGVFDRTSGLEKPRDLAEWRPWALIGRRRRKIAKSAIRPQSGRRERLGFDPTFWSQIETPRPPRQSRNIRDSERCSRDPGAW